MPLRTVPFFNLYIVVFADTIMPESSPLLECKAPESDKACLLWSCICSFPISLACMLCTSMWSQSLVSTEREEQPQECIDCHAAASMEVVEQDLESCLACNSSEPMFWLTANVAFLITLRIPALCWADVFAMGTNNNIESTIWMITCCLRTWAWKLKTKN